MFQIKVSEEKACYFEQKVGGGSVNVGTESNNPMKSIQKREC